MGCDPALEAEFVESWERVLRFYADLLKQESWDFLAGMHALVIRLRAAGYNRTLRAGQSMTTLLVSRSRAHGLRDDQAFLSLSPRSNRRALIDIRAHRFFRNRRFWSASDADLEPVFELLDALVQVPID